MGKDERKMTPCASETVSRLAAQLGSFKEARDALDYLDRRRGNMRYGWLRRNGHCISSSHVEAAARILVARRCKQAGMHWRHARALKLDAKSVIIAHNHPSGNPTPSESDVGMTEKLVAASKLVQVPLLDHLVLGSPDSGGGNGYISILHLCKHNA